MYRFGKPSPLKWGGEDKISASSSGSDSSEDFDPDDVEIPSSFQDTSGKALQKRTTERYGQMNSNETLVTYSGGHVLKKDDFVAYRADPSKTIGKSKSFAAATSTITSTSSDAAEPPPNFQQINSLQKSDVSNMWCGEKTEKKVDIDDEELEDEDLGVDATYDAYMPSKLTIGERHPDLVVESNSLASVLPPNIKYKLGLPGHIITSRKLSALQLESVVYACQQHEHFLQNGERAGYLIGDGPGVGKGRTLAGIIYENYLRGRKKSLWISVSSDLMYDAARDLIDIGADISVYALNKLKYQKIDETEMKHGVLFSTYASLISSSKQEPEFTRLNQIVDWCGLDFNGVIVFDECHRAKNLLGSHCSRSTKTGSCVAELQKLLPKARVVYSSATGASEPKDMAYMIRLGLWGPGTPFEDFDRFIEAVELRGIGAMEIVAMDMKLRGSYIARQLSFNGVKFSVENAILTKENIAVYDESVKMWVEVIETFKTAIDLLHIEGSFIWSKFWAAHQRFFKCLCIAFKVPVALTIARDAVKYGKCVVMALQSTGEARTLGQLDKDNGQLTDFVSTAKSILEQLVESHFPLHSNSIYLNKGLPTETVQKVLNAVNHKKKLYERKRKMNKKRLQQKKKAKKGAVTFSDSSDSWDSDEVSSSGSDWEVTDNERPANYFVGGNVGSDTHQLLQKMKQDLLVKINRLGKKLPYNTLDYIINELGGPDFVAELTGRKGRVTQTDSGEIAYETRAEDDESAEATNRIEKQRFLDGEKLFAIISEAASCGISLHSDRRFKNRRRRVHIILELPWSADRAIQQFGRTHRSNQVNCPEYVLLISDLAGENRFASIVAKRLESLGALTHGDRRATGPRDLSRFNIDNRFGKKALNTVMKFIREKLPTADAGPALNITIPDAYKGDLASLQADIRDALVGVCLLRQVGDLYNLDKERCSMTKFLNRILGMPVMMQNALFQYFLNTLDEIMINAKKTRQFDMGILDLCESGFGGEVKCEKTAKFVRDHATGSGLIELHKLFVEKGMSWKAATAKYEELVGKYAAYYLSFQFRRVTLADISKKNRIVEPEVAQRHWVLQYEASKNVCSHVLWQGKCSRQTEGGKLCETGLRTKTYHVLSGAVLSVWNEVEAVLGSHKDTAKMQIVRVKSGEQKFVGLLIPNGFVDELMKKLKREGQGSSAINHEDERDREHGRQNQSQAQTSKFTCNQLWLRRYIH